MKQLGAIMIFSLFSVAFYPNPAEIIILVIIGLGILNFVSYFYKRWELTHRDNDQKNKITKNIFQAAIFCFIVVFMIVFRTSWFENKIIFNVFQAERGKHLVVITLGFLFLALLYALLFHDKYKRWPNDEDIESNLTKLKSRNLTLKESKFLIATVLLIVFFMFGWFLYLIFSAA